MSDFKIVTSLYQKCHSSLQCPLPEYYYCAECPTASLCTSGQHLALWLLTQDSLDFQQHLLLLCVCMCKKVCLLSPMHVCHLSCMQPPGKTPDVRPHIHSSSHSLQTWASQSPEPADETYCKLRVIWYSSPIFSMHSQLYIPELPYSLRHWVCPKGMKQEDGLKEKMCVRNVEHHAALSEISGICVSSRG